MSDNSPDSRQTAPTDQQSPVDNSPNGGRLPQDTDEDQHDHDCPICLLQITDPAFTDPCLHAFCRVCIDQWTNQHNHCPVCRQAYHRILYNVRGDFEYEERPVEPVEFHQINPLLELLPFNFNAFGQGLQFPRNPVMPPEFGVFDGPFGVEVEPEPELRGRGVQLEHDIVRQQIFRLPEPTPPRVEQLMLLPPPPRLEVGEDNGPVQQLPDEGEHAEEHLEEPLEHHVEEPELPPQPAQPDDEEQAPAPRAAHRHFHFHRGGGNRRTDRHRRRR